MALANRNIKNRIIDSISIIEGVVDGHTLVEAFGYNTGITATVADISVKGGVKTYALVTGATTTTLVSGSATDQAGTTGALTARIYGVDLNWDKAQEDITLAGSSTTVAAVTQFLRVNKVEVLTAGSGAANVGTLTCAIGSNVECIVKPALNQGEICSIHVPRNHIAYITNISAYSDRVALQVLDVQLQVRDTGGVFRTVRDIKVTGNVYQDCFIPVLHKADVRLQATLVVAGQVSSTLRYYLVNYGENYTSTAAFVAKGGDYVLTG